MSIVEVGHLRKEYPDATPLAVAGIALVGLLSAGALALTLARRRC